MASADDYAQWIVVNESKKGTPEFNTVAQAYKEAKAEEAGGIKLTAPPPQRGFKSEFANQLADLGVGAIGEGAKFLGRILPGTTGEQLQAKTEKYLTPKNYQLNPEAIGYGRTMSDVGLGATLGPTLGAASKLVGATKIAPALASAGTNLGELTTGSKLANALMRGTMGAGQGAAVSGMINPEDAWKGAIAGGALANVPAVLESTKELAPGLMQSALKPVLPQLQKGDAQRAIQTLLQENVSPNAAGMNKLGGKVGELNAEISDLVHGSPQVISKQKVIDIANQARPQMMLPVNSQEDIKTLNDVIGKFSAHPLLQGSEDISIPLAQEMKQATYRSLGDKAYGELGSASRQSQKALARGLKEQIAANVPAVQGLNQRESDLINAMDVIERRALLEGNKNPLGLGTLTPSKEMFALHMADKSGNIKAKLARELYNMGVSSKALEKAGLVGIPAALSAKNQGEQ
jgi:hypothetical protein